MAAQDAAHAIARARGLTVTAMLGRSILFNTVVQVWQSASGYVIALILARYLGPAGYGAYGVVYSVLLATELIARLGVPLAVTRLVAAGPEQGRNITRAGVALTLAVTSVITIAIVLAAPWLAELLSLPDGAALLRIAAIDIPFFGLYLVLNATLQGEHRFNLATMATAVYASVKVAGVIALIPSGPSAAGALLVNAAGSVIALLFCLRMTGFGILRPSWQHARPIWSLAAPVALRGVAGQLLLSLDLWALGMAGAMVSASERGFYVAAVSIARMPGIVVLGSVGMLIATLTRTLAGGDRPAARATLESALRWLLALLVPAATLLAVNAREGMDLLFGDEYGNGSPFLAVLVFGHGLAAPLLTIVTGALIAAAQPGAAARSAFAALALLVVLLLSLVPAAGAIGAATASLAATSAAATFAGLAARRAFGSPLMRAHTLLRIGLAALVVGALGWQIPSSGVAVLVELAALGLLSLVLVMLLGVIRRGELKSLMGVD